MQASKKGKCKSVDIPLGVLKEATNQIEKVYGHGNVVIIGGRAVNLQCVMNARGTHDVDLIVPWKPTRADMQTLPDKEASPHSYFYYSGDINSATRAKLYYQSASMAEPIEIDLYYPFYLTKSEIGGNGLSIGGIIPVPIDAIVKEAETVRIGDMDFKVSKPEAIMVMKYNTWLERGKGKSESKDMEDLMNIIRNHANDPAKLIILMGKVKAFLEEYVPEKSITAYNGMLLSIPFTKIKDTDPNLPRIAQDLINKRYLLRAG